MMNRRERKLIRPDIRVRGILFSLIVALGAICLQSVTMTIMLHRVASWSPTDGPAILQALPQVVGISASISFVVLAPVILALKLRATREVAGPVHRIEQASQDEGATETEDRSDLAA